MHQFSLPRYPFVTNMAALASLWLALVSMPARAAVERPFECAPEQWREIEGLVYRKAVVPNDVLGNFVDPHGTTTPTVTRAMLEHATRLLGSEFSVADASRPLDSPLPYLVLQHVQRDDLPGAVRELSVLKPLLESRSRLSCLSRLSPLQKLFEQQAYWDVYSSLQLLMGSNGEASRAAGRDAGEIRRLLAGLIHRVRLGEQELEQLQARELGDPALADVIQRFLGSADYTLANISHTQSTTLHSIVINGRGYFESYAVVRSGRDAVHLERWLEFVRLSNDLVASQGREGWDAANDALPRSPPNGTVFLLVRYPFALDVAGVLRPTKVVERISVRRYVVPSVGRAFDQYGLFELDVNSAIHQGILKYSTVDLDSLVWGGLLAGAPDPISFQGSAAVTSVRNNCAACHNFVSPGPGDIASDGGAKLAGAPRSATQAELTAAYLQSGELPAFRDLHADLTTFGEGHR